MAPLPKLNKTWRVTYVCGPTTLNMEVEAQSEDEAVMRAGMLRSIRLHPNRGMGIFFNDRRQWKRVKCECL